VLKPIKDETQDDVITTAPEFVTDGPEEITSKTSVSPTTEIIKIMSSSTTSTEITSTTTTTTTTATTTDITSTTTTTTTATTTDSQILTEQLIKPVCR